MRISGLLAALLLLHLQPSAADTPIAAAKVRVYPDGTAAANYPTTTPVVQMDFVQWPGFTHIKANVDFSSFTCSSGEFSWHIHEQFVPDGTIVASDAVDCTTGDGCGSAVTGGHYDPVRGVGVRTDYSCDSQSDLSDCEVGDSSGRYGKKFSVTETWEFNDQFLMLSEIVDRSIVFHCALQGSAPRVAGGKIQAVDISASGYSIPTKPDTSFKIYKAKGDSFEVTMDPNTGEVKIEMDKPTETECASGELNWHIHADWKHTDKSSAAGADDCGGSYTGGHWDPVYACGPATSHNSTICPEQVKSDYSTSCQLANDDSYSCELGDFGSRLGKSSFTNNVWKQTYSNVIGVDVSGTQKRSIVFHCGSPRVFCAEFKEVVSGGDGDGDGDASTASCAVASIFSLVIAVLFI